VVITTTSLAKRVIKNEIRNMGIVKYTEKDEVIEVLLKVCKTTKLL